MLAYPLKCRDKMVGFVGGLFSFSLLYLSLTSSLAVAKLCCEADCKREFFLCVVVEVAW